MKKNSFHVDSLQEMSRILTTISVVDKEKLFKGMLITRACDNALKHLFLSGKIIYENKAFQGKGFRSLGQEAIFGATLKLKTGPDFLDNGVYTGDVSAPVIRDLGVFLAMNNGDIASVINAQAGKLGSPSDGRDLHIGDFAKGILTPAAPLAIATVTLIGIALSFKKKKEARIAISFIGEGGSSLGEWHEAINFAAVLELPMIFCIENNQIALSTKTTFQSKAKSFADKGIGYGIRSLSIDGNDVEMIAIAFKLAGDLARLGDGPILIELNTMRMCGHAHHDDMSYLGYDPPLNFEIPPLRQGGYADKGLFEKWLNEDPIKRYEKKLLEENVLDEASIKHFKEEAITKVNDAVKEVIARPWPKFSGTDYELVWKNPSVFIKKKSQKLEHHFREDGATYLQAIAEGVRHIFIEHKNSLVIGEDVAPPYGNAFMMFKNMNDFSDRFINTPISENAIVGACVGLSMSGFLPIGEIQFNDFVACAMNQVINNAGTSFFRLGINLPMVLRLPYGGQRRAGPFHSQDTSPWFYRSPGLKIMAPSTPNDAMHMLIKAVTDPDPVLFFEHIALYREPKIKQKLSLNYEFVDGAALINDGLDLSIISYGSFVHRAKSAALHLFKEHGMSADVIDLRYLMPLDLNTIHESVKKTSRVLLIGEDKKTGGILESLASIIGQELFHELDAPVTVLGSRDIPVPYAPSLEDDYLLSLQQIIAAAIKVREF